LLEPRIDYLGARKLHHGARLGDISNMSVVTLSGSLAAPIDGRVADHLRAPAGIRRSSAALDARNEAIDAVRLFAAAGIVFVHAVESSAFIKWGNLFRFGVPFFLFASLYFQSLSLRRHGDRSLFRFIVGRFERLYLPFVTWSLIYLCARDLERIFLHHLPPVEPRLSMLLSGTEYHLWFLPFLLGWTVLLAALHRGLIQRDARCRWLIVATAITVGCAVASLKLPIYPAWGTGVDDSSYTYSQWMLATPAACGALAFACVMTMGTTIYTIPAVLGWGGLALVAACSLRQALDGIELFPRALTGFGSMLVALIPWKTSAIPALARIGRKGYGIYLCHVFPVEIIHLVSHKCHLPASACLDVATFAISFLGAWGIVVLLGKSRWLAWLNG
jgi:fucose 4-O-acetylase-like acetyltransferase